MKAATGIDDVDSSIIRLLQRHGRHSIASVARECGMSETAVRRRVDRLVSDGTIKFVTVVNPLAAGYAVDVMFTIKAQAGKVESIVEHLEAKHDVVWLSYVTGPCQIMGEAVLKDQEELYGFLYRFLGGIDGVEWVETFDILRNVKFDYEWRPSDE